LAKSPTKHVTSIEKKGLIIEEDSDKKSGNGNLVLSISTYENT
jgi:hypothetical protein